MVIKVYTSGISGNKEVKKRQQRIMMILESKVIKYETVDITEPGNEEEKQFMQGHAESKGQRNPLPPQIFNESDYCGDYDGFDLANENDTLEEFLKLPIPVRVNGDPMPATGPKSDKLPENNSDKESNHINYEIRHEEIIERLVPDTEQNFDEVKIPVKKVRAVINSYCYTPYLAKRLLKLAYDSLKKSRKETVHGYCFTPSLAQRLTKVIVESCKIPKELTPPPRPNKQLNEDQEMDEEEEEDEIIQESDSMKDVTDSDLKMDSSEIAVEGEE